MFIIVPPQGYYSDFATVIATASTAEEAIKIAEKEDGVVYRATGYVEGSKIPRAAIEHMRADGRFVGPNPQTHVGLRMLSIEKQ